MLRTCCPHFWNGEAGEGAGNDIADDPVGVLACIAIGFVIANVLLFQWKIYYYSRKDLRLGLCAFATTFFSKVILLFALAAFTETGYIARGLGEPSRRPCPPPRAFITTRHPPLPALPSTPKFVTG